MELGVAVGAGVLVLVGVPVGWRVEVIVATAVRVGGSPTRVKAPETFHWVPA